MSYERTAAVVSVRAFYVVNRNRCGTFNNGAPIKTCNAEVHLRKVRFGRAFVWRVRSTPRMAAENALYKIPDWLIITFSVSAALQVKYSALGEECRDIRS